MYNWWAQMQTSKKLATTIICKNVVKQFMAIALLNMFSSLELNVKYSYYQGNVNECLKDISLGNVFKNILWNDKTINYIDIFFIFPTKIILKYS